MNRRPKKLQLRREDLGELTADELTQVAGGQAIGLPTSMCTGYYPSINAPCTTWIATTI